MLEFKISPANSKPLYANGIKEYNIQITEDDPNASYRILKFNVVSSPPRAFMALKGTFDVINSKYLEETTINIDTAQPGQINHSEPLKIKLGAQRCSEFKADGIINLLIELQAGVGDLGTVVPTPSGGFPVSSDNSSPGYLSLLINNVCATIDDENSIRVFVTELPP